MKIFAASFLVLSSAGPSAKAFQLSATTSFRSHQITTSSGRLYETLFQENSVNHAWSTKPPKNKNCVGSIDSSSTQQVREDSRLRGTMEAPTTLIPTRRTTVFIHEQPEDEVQIVAGIPIAKQQPSKRKEEKEEQAEEPVEEEIAPPPFFAEKEEIRVDAINAPPPPQTTTMEEPATTMEERIEEEKAEIEEEDEEVEVEEQQQLQQQQQQPAEPEAVVGAAEGTEPNPNNIYPIGLSLDDFTDEAYESIQHATKHLKRQCPNVNPDLLHLMFWIQHGQAPEATVALKKLLALVQQETPEEETATTTALFRIGGHIDIARTIMFHPEDETLQFIGLQVINELSSSERAEKIQCEDEINNIQKSFAAVGLLDSAFEAMERYPKNIALATTSLQVVNNLIPTYTLDQILSKDIDLVTRTMIVMEEKYPDNPSILLVGCDILSRIAGSMDHASAATSSSSSSSVRDKFEQVNAIPFLANVMKRFKDGYNERVPIKAEIAMISILMMGKE